MGLDLKLLPAYGVSSTDLSLTVLSMWRGEALFDLIMEIPATPVPKEGLTSPISRGDLKKDKYGDPLMYVKVRELCHVLKEYNSRDRENKAALAYLSKLPKDLPVYLYWC